MRLLASVHVVFAIAAATMPACACAAGPAGTGAAIAATHARLAAQLLPQQAALLAAARPGQQVVHVCRGNFSGGSAGEAVLGLWDQHEVRRVGLLWRQGRWQLHDVDRELERDLARSRSVPLAWEHTLDAAGFHGAMKCNAEATRDPDLSSAGKLLDGRPSFSLGAPGARRASACYASSAQYNNWDCVAWDPRRRRFALWYQQAFAD